MRWQRGGFVKVLIAYLVVISCFLPLITLANPPAWWEQRGVLDENAEVNDHAPVNQGQLKHIASKAKDELDANLPGGAGPEVTDLVNGFSLTDSNYSPVNLGQLKNVAKPFYDRLIASGFAANYPWITTSSRYSDHAMVNIGQVKNVFSFELPSLADTDENGLPDSWEIQHFGQIGANPDGDNDNDGISNYQEFLGNSNPINFYSRPGITIVPYISIVTGNNQQGRSNRFLDQSFAIEVRNGMGGDVIENAPVLFSVVSGGGGLNSLAQDPVSGNVTVLTGPNGISEAWYRQGSIVGINSSISARAGMSNVVYFTATTLDVAGHWNFDEGTGTLAAESMDTSADGTLSSGASWTQGFDGNSAVSFDGSGGYVSMETADDLLDLEDYSFSIVAWVKFEQSPSALDTVRIVGKGDSNSEGGYFLDVAEGGKLIAGLGAGSEGISETVKFQTVESFNDGQWHHVAVVFNRATSAGTLTVDGVARAVSLASGSVGSVVGNSVSYVGFNELSASASNASFVVGSQGGVSDFFAGSVDDLKIYQKALTPSEIAELRNVDQDQDGIADWWEGKFFQGLNSDPNADADSDGLSNLQEYEIGTNPIQQDTDADGMKDGWEISYGFNPLDASGSDLDPDGDGLTNAQESLAGTNPNNSDTDEDGMPDRWEVVFGLNPLGVDANGDLDSDGSQNNRDARPNDTNFGQMNIIISTPSNGGTVQ